MDELKRVVAVDVGGATTDVYSVGEGAPTRAGTVCKGLPKALQIAADHSGRFLIKDALDLVTCLFLFPDNFLGMILRIAVHNRVYV